MTTSAFEGLEDQLGLERRKVDVGSVSFSVRELVRMYEDGELSIAPSYQRKYRWPRNVASTFIESIFLGLPIPPIFVATNSDFKWEVVDGLQRISTLILFLSDDEATLRHIGRDEPLRLTGLQKLSQLNDVTHDELPPAIQRYFARQALQVISLTDKSDRAVRFDLFERLNTGAISLSAQEVRSAVYGGDFLTFVESLAQNKDLHTLLKLQEANQHDGTVDEQVLKYFAYKNNQQAFTGAVTKFLNKYAATAHEGFDYRAERATFEQSMHALSTIVGGPFLRRGMSVTPLTEFEACAVAAGRIIEAGERLEAPPSGWLDDPELVSASTGGTNTRAMLGRRIQRAEELLRGH